MINRFDPKTALFAKHAQHVVLIHFPIALYLTGVAFDVVAEWTKWLDLGGGGWLQPDRGGYSPRFRRLLPG